MAWVVPSKRISLRLRYAGVREIRPFRSRSKGSSGKSALQEYNRVQFVVAMTGDAVCRLSEDAPQVILILRF